MSDIIVEGRAGDPAATMAAFGEAIPATLGRAGLLHDGATPAEGDFATPTGAFALRQILYRPDREPRPLTRLPLIPIRPEDGWCDDPAHALYNRPITRPFGPSHERLWREDRAYDLVVVLDFNLRQPEPGRGSAIFWHLTKTDAGPPTAGCVAISPSAMRRLLPRLAPGDRLVIERSKDGGES